LRPIAPKLLFIATKATLFYDKPMKIQRGITANKHRDAWVEVNIGNLEHNIMEIKEMLGNVKIMAIVKADAYGHGAVMCSHTLLACGVEELGVASIDEGIELRNNKITAPVLVLGAAPIWAFESALKNDLAISIFSEQHLEAAKLLYDKNGGCIKAHIKVDTGMNRIGINTDNAKEFIEKAQKAPYLKLEGIFTHFADCEDKKILDMQADKFSRLIESVDTKGLTIHCSNSGTSFLNKELRCDMLRLGIVLYGLTPFCMPHKELPDLKQVIGLKGRITNIHPVKKDEGVSYGHDFHSAQDTRIATIPIGYADGVARSLSGLIEGRLNNKAVKQVGKITMDQMMFDINDEKAEVGDIITLLGDGLSINDWAETLGTINYELTCRLKVRLPRIYTR